MADIVCSFNTDKRYLGNICKRGHHYLDTGKCLRSIKGNHCIECNKERKRTPKYKATQKITIKKWRERQGPEYKRKEAERKKFKRANDFNEMIRGRLHKAETKALIAGCVINPVKPSHIRAIWNKFDYCCAYCGTHENNLKNKLEIEHVVCFKRNGPHIPSNIVPSCTECNSLKRANPLETWYPKQTFFSKERFKKIKKS